VNSYRLSFDRELKRRVSELPGKLRQEVKRRIADLARDPRPAGAVELRGHPDVYRVWLSDARYRLVWQIFEQELRVAIYYAGRKPDYEALLDED